MFHAFEIGRWSLASRPASLAAVSFGNGATWAAVAKRSGGRRLYGFGSTFNSQTGVTCKYMWMGSVKNM